MARLEYFLVAEDLAIDQTTNRLSLFNVLDELQAPGFPLLVSKCVAVSAWQREPEDEGRDFQAILRIITPSGEPREVEANFRMINVRHRIITRIQGMPLTATGEVRFELLLNGRYCASHVVTIEQQPPEDPPAVTH